MTIRGVSMAKLPAGFSAKAVDPDADSEAVTALCEATAIADDGYSDVTLQAVRESYNTPGFDPATDARLVFDGAGRLVGVVEFYDIDDQHVAPFVYARVHPDSIASGVGEALLAWAAERGGQAAELAKGDLRVALHSNTPGVNRGMQQIFERSGWRFERINWEMEILLDEAPAVPPLPAPMLMRTARRGEDEPAIYTAEIEAFADHYGYMPRPYESWLQLATAVFPYDPTLWFLAADNEQIAGISLCQLDQLGRPDSGYVGTLGVRPAWRGEGVGLSLLRHSFAELYRRGKRRIALHVDSQSLTGATRLYERGGMRVVRDSRAYELVLREGREVRPV
jgi:mycothiol synthase